jgi:lipoyl(octanoyl) transferase
VLVENRLSELAPYEATRQAMLTFTQERTADTPDTLWLVQHPPVFTLGLAGKTEHLLDAGDVPVVQTERGGQVTYHGPGQIMLYCLLDVRRLKLGVRDLVCRLERCVIVYLQTLGISAVGKRDAPGVYVLGPDGQASAKIAALGLKVKQGCCFHGLALNVDMDLSPFGRINPCGYPGLAVTDVKSCLSSDQPLPSLISMGDALALSFLQELAHPTC